MPPNLKATDTDLNEGFYPCPIPSFTFLLLPHTHERA